MNKVWTFIIVVGLVFNILFFDSEKLLLALFDVPKESLKLLLTIGGMLMFWGGFFNIAIESKLINRLSKYFLRLSCFLFPDIPANNLAHEYICANILANILGLGSASQSLGIKALEEMNKINKDKTQASRSMITLVLLNTSSLTIFPITLFSLRQMFHTKLNMSILPFIIISTFISMIITVIIDRLFAKVRN